MRVPGSGRFWAYVSILLLVIIVAASSVTVVPAGSVGVITRFGAVNRVFNPGLSWRVPLVEGYVEMDVRTLKDQVDVSAASKDLQAVTSTIAVNYHLDGRYAADVYQNVGTSYADVLIAPAVQNIFKATTAQFTAEELITKREQVRVEAEQALTDQLASYHVIVENFNIVDFSFSPEFNAAIEQKQVAQQQVETAKQLLAKAQVEADTARTVAQGQADAIKILQNSGSLSPEYLQWLAINKWDGRLPYATSGMPFINLTPPTGNTTPDSTATTP